ncbi:hypothetical protein ABE65_010400 [Fictibacillus phosphorivorans]|uniref:Uncharacterized protein n=2 Tax=Fictibacillus phosphorivorans TaxID=1221500 RepID=A0A160IN14_9BACL|nr:hypothetical protein ABE65_010400 [Fictibacillus phosphorivorans]
MEEPVQILNLETLLPAAPIFILLIIFVVISLVVVIMTRKLPKQVTLLILGVSWTIGLMWWMNTL